MDPAWYRRRRWALYGALILVLVNVVWAWIAGGPEWTNPAIVGAPVAALLGVVLGYVAARLCERRDR